MKNKKLTRSVALLLACLHTLTLGSWPLAADDDHDHEHGGRANGQPGGQPLVAMGRTSCIGRLAKSNHMTLAQTASF